MILGYFGDILKLYSLRDSRQPKHPGRSMFQVFVSIILDSFWDLSGIDFRHLGGRFSILGGQFGNFLVPFGVPKPPGTPPRALVAPKMGPRTSPESLFGAKSGPREPSEGQTGAKKGPRRAQNPQKINQKNDRKNVTRTYRKKDALEATQPPFEALNDGFPLGKRANPT